MHVELVVPSMLAAQPVPRLPALELLFARGRASHDEPRPLEPWLAHAFGIAEAPPPAGALTVLASGGDPGNAYWMRADPVHLEIGREGPALAPPGADEISQAEANALVGALNQHLGANFALQAAHPRCWCLRVAHEISIDMASPAEASAAGELLPQGSGARDALALLTEIQLVLHDHAVNQAREQRGAPAINSLWLWGAGRLPRSAHTPWQSVASDDLLALGLARLAGARHGALPAGAQQWLEQAPRDGRHLVLLAPVHAGQPLESLEPLWFAPLLQALREGRVGMVTVRDPGSGMACEATRADLRRFWRRPRPLGSAA